MRCSGGSIACRLDSVTLIQLQVESSFICSNSLVAASLSESRNLPAWNGNAHQCRLSQIDKEWVGASENENESATLPPPTVLPVGDGIEAN